MLQSWFIDHGPQIVLVIGIALVVHRFARVFIERIIRQTIRSHEGLSPAAEKKREDTLISVFAQLVVVGVWLMAAMMVLSEMGVDTGPLIASAGIVGIAFGFGGQYLIKDIISGFFIILENQYRVGDVISVNAGDYQGVVDEINLRITTLRDPEGTLHYIPNGEIKVASNLTKEYAKVNLDIGVAYEEKLNRVEKVINQVGEALAADPEWEKTIIEAPKFLRVNDLGDSAVIVRVRGKVRSDKQWAVTGELRRRLKEAFDEAKIEMPYPQMVVHQKK